MAASLALAIWGLVWPFRVWRDEPPSRRGYHWAMPVDRRRHDLLRVAAGAIWLGVVAVGVAAAAVVAAVAAGHAGRLGALPIPVWLSLFTAPLILYLAASIPAVRTERPALWTWGAVGVLPIVASLGATRAFAFLNGLFFGRLGLVAAFAGCVPAVPPHFAPPSLGRWAAATLLWLAVAAAGVWAAASTRPRNL